MVGAVIGSYQIVRKLGSGGMGAVYLAHHTLLGRRAAIKVLLPSLSARQDVVRRFFNEARAVTSISDPGIVQVFDFGYHSDGSAFIVMELLEGETLDRRLARLGKLAVPSALQLCRQLASSLEAAHAQRIIHRDLKPENIFLVRDSASPSGERPKILDFGIAKLSDNPPGATDTSTGVLMGTPRYMSPEQCRGLGEIDHRSDIYALGCVLFHLVTGRPPFHSPGVGDIISAHIREPAPAPSSMAPGIPAAVDALVLRCLAKPPADRFPSMAELAAALGRLAPQAPVDAVSLPLPDAAGGPSASAPRSVLDPRSSPIALVPTAPTTLGESSGQFARPLPRTTAGRRWIAALLVLAAAGVVLAVRCAPDRGTRDAATNRDAVAADPADTRPPDTRPPVVAPPGVPAAAVDASAGSAAVAADASAGPAEPRPTDEHSEIEIEPRPGEPTPPAPTGSGAAATPDPASPAPPATPGTPPKPPQRPGAPPSIAAQKKCSKTRFTSVVKAEINAALRDLAYCRSVGALTNDEYNRYQSALIKRL